MVIEKTLVLLKPDTVQRGIMGKILTRFEDSGLKIIAMKMIQANAEMAEKHYELDEDWAKNVYNKTKASYEKDNKKMEYVDHMDLGKTIQKWNMDFLQEAPVIALVLEGPHAIELIRKMLGATEPRSAAPGTIRGDFATIESYALADVKKRVARNLVHASDSVENAEREISTWFSTSELHSYTKDLDKFL
jgi:nucleoside-diphosphate kinase